MYTNVDFCLILEIKYENIKKKRKIKYWNISKRTYQFATQNSQFFYIHICLKPNTGQF